ncbi:GNAT family N-acetyltransferase [Peribacillus glennii]|uniref:GNAT family N-acetyltransferase n=1 Tax=Peribacillus glennii TaxID=2303991 RepID=A0A372LGZ3_9BACI|nr:GNAT family N-acetyltransferase [Peribacillus glennii]RFU64886.1 GNAT family N-acetyltransferase [Peribacillus glennii]
MELDVITTIEELERERPAWDNLLEKNQNNNPFIEFDWIYSWWKIFGEDYELFVIIAKIEGETKAYFPFMKKKGLFVERIHFIGYGQANYMDIISGTWNKGQVIEYVIQKLLDSKKSRIFHLHGMLQSEETYACFIKSIEASTDIFYQSSVVAPFVNITEIDIEQYCHSRQKKHGVDRKEKRLKELGTVSIQPLQSKFYEQMFALHAKRWREKNDTSGFSKGKTKEFFNQLAQNDSKTFQTKIDALFLDGQLIALLYGFQCRNRYLFYLPAHDDDFGMYSPGRILFKEKIKECASSEISIFDMSIGYEPYKMDWNNGMDYVSTVIFPTNNMTARIFFLFLTSKDRLIAFLKKNRSLVHFKRNTLGKLKAFMLNNKVKGLIMGAVHTMQAKISDLFFNDEYILYRYDFPTDSGYIDLKWRKATVHDVEKLAIMQKKNKKDLIHRLFRKQRCYVVVIDNKIIHSFWLSAAEITIGDLGYRETLNKYEAFIYDLSWTEEQLINVSFLVKDFKTIYLTVNKKNTKCIDLCKKQGLFVEKRIKKRTFFSVRKLKA